eukprot:6878940-Pyramimonas_sp.AAC.1
MSSQLNGNGRFMALRQSTNCWAARRYLARAAAPIWASRSFPRPALVARLSAGLDCFPMHQARRRVRG